jgi:sugar lactone lactonase YvrE
VKSHLIVARCVSPLSKNSRKAVAFSGTQRKELASSRRGWWRTSVPFAFLILGAAQAWAAFPLQDFGTQAVNAPVSGSETITFAFTGVSAPVLSLAGKDFSVGASGCNAAFTICTATVSFVPVLPGLRQDALTAKDTTGNKQIVTLLRGIGLGPRLAFAPGIIATFAGNGSWGYVNSAKPSTASFRNPQGVASDSAGNIYVADSINMVIRRIDAVTGAVTTAAGNGTAGKSGDGGPAINAMLNAPTGVAVDAAGNLYIADQGNGLIRRVDVLSGLISTAAGGGTTLSGVDGLGDGLIATSAVLSGPNHVAVDGAGNIFIADSFHALIRKVSAATGIITAVAGGGSGGGSDGLGDNGPATAATLSDPNGVTLDAAGNLYVADSGNSLVRVVNASTGNISVVAGTGANGYSGDGGPAVSARLSAPAGITLDAAGNLYIADFGNSLIRQVNAASGLISTLAGASTGYSGDGGPSNAAQLNQPTDLAFGADGNIYIADYSNNVVRQITFLQSPITFPSTNVGTVTSASNVLLANIGNATVSITSIALTVGFVQKPSGGMDCSTSISSGGSCLVAVVFAPTTAGAISGSLKLVSNNLNQPAAANTVSLSGTALAGTPQANLSANSLTFPVQAVGSASGGQNVILTNPGNAALTISSIWLAGTNAGDFSISTTCAASLAVSASCVTSVTFRPLVAGTRTAVLTFSDRLANSPQTVTLTGIGSGGALVSFNPAGLSFGSLVVGAKSSALNVVVTNTGSTALSIYGIALTGANGGDFSILSTTCGASLNASANCTITLAFGPTALGARTAALVLTDSAGDTPQSLSLSGSGVAQSLSVTPTALSFGSQIVGATGAAQTVTFSNFSGATITFGGLGFVGPNSADFSTTANTCVATLATGSSCSVSLAFNPSAAGARSASLILIDSAANSPQAVSLTGSGTATSLSVTPASLSFGSLAVGTKSAPQTVTITAASGAIAFSSLTLAGANSADFAIAGNTCPASLTNGASCSVTLTFTPTATSARSATMVLADSAGNSPQSVSLSGTGTGVPGTLSFLPASLSFGSVPVGTNSAPQSVTLSVASGAVAFSGLTLAGPNAADFSITGNTCPASVASGGSCIVTLAFTPAAIGTRSATIVFTDTAGNSPQSVPVSGLGTAVASSLSVTPPNLSFGSFAVGYQSGPQTAILTAVSANVALNGLTLSGAADFTIIGNTCPALLASGTSCNVILSFTPAAAGVRSATMVLTDSAGNSPQSISLTGTGAGPAGSVSITPPSLTFGLLAVGTTSTPQSVTLSVVSGAVAFTGVALSGTNASDFSILSNTCPAILGNGATCSVSIAFKPLAAGTRSATMVLTDSAGNSPQSVPLSGVGGTVTAPSISVTPATLTFGSLVVGTKSAAQGITLSNSSGTSVAINSFALTGANSADFSMSANTCSTTLASGSSCSVSLVFTPGAVGSRSTSLNIADTAAGSPQAVTLGGNGTTGGQVQGVFQGFDTTTEGSWKGVYGGDGYVIANAGSSLPAYATVIVTGASTYTWIASTVGLVALQKPNPATDRLAAAYYSFSNFTFDVNLTDGQIHQLALYCLDLDTTQRIENISITDAVSGAALDSENIANFHNGIYAVWNLQGHVHIQVTSTSGLNAVVSGLFFAP